MELNKLNNEDLVFVSRKGKRNFALEALKILISRDVTRSHEMLIVVQGGTTDLVAKKALAALLKNPGVSEYEISIAACSARSEILANVACDYLLKKKDVVIDAVIVIIENSDYESTREKAINFVSSNFSSNRNDAFKILNRWSGKLFGRFEDKLLCLSDLTINDLVAIRQRTPNAETFIECTRRIVSFEDVPQNVLIEFSHSHTNDTASLLALEKLLTIKDVTLQSLERVLQYTKFESIIERIIEKFEIGENTSFDDLNFLDRKVNGKFANCKHKIHQLIIKSKDATPEYLTEIANSRDVTDEIALAALDRLIAWPYIIDDFLVLVVDHGKTEYIRKKAADSYRSEHYIFMRSLLKNYY